MSDKIRLLADHIANQIAAGEVIQRPANALKELLENAIDAEATEVKIFIEDAGKSLLQVIDNGCGMSETDARMAFERHATSKVSTLEDLFNIKTMGFRGEALASIGSVATVQLKTKRANDELGTFIEIEKSTVINQEPIITPNGTNIAMKNLFFNIPARRNFLKSNATELKALYEEFIRIAIAFPEIQFNFFVEKEEKFHLTKNSLNQRIIQVLGTQYQKTMIRVEEKTESFEVFGFIGKPESAKKQRGDQYIFVNNRFIKNYYLEHAIKSAYGNLIAEQYFPFYCLFLTLSPQLVDINVHPTKQEVKFSEDKWIYAVIQSVIKHSLAQLNIIPALDFTQELTIPNVTDLPKNPNIEKIKQTEIFQTFTQKNQAHLLQPLSNQTKNDWANFYTPLEQKNNNPTIPNIANFQYYDLNDEIDFDAESFHFIQILNSFIAVSYHSGLLIINQQYAHERILFESINQNLQQQKVSCQRLLFPHTFSPSTADWAIFEEMVPHLNLLGFDISIYQQNNYLVQGIPAGYIEGPDDILEKLLEQYKLLTANFKAAIQEKLIRCLAKSQSIKCGQKLTDKEMENIVKQLFKTSEPKINPAGYPTYKIIKQNELDGFFIRKK